MESFEETGNWWIPGSTEKVSGEVEYHPTDGITLDLDGTFLEDENSTSLPETEPKEVSIIYGDIGRKGAITLIDSILSSSHFDGHEKFEEYMSHKAIIGDHISEEEQFVKADIRVGEIPDWSNSTIIRPLSDTNSIEEATDIDNINDAYALVGFDEYSAQVDELRLRILNYGSIEYDMNSVAMNTIGALELSSDNKLSIDDMFGRISHAMEYLSFAMGTGIYPDDVYFYTDSEEYPLDVYYIFSDYSNDRFPSKYDYIFQPNGIDFDASAEAWMKLQKEAPEIHRYYRLLLHRSDLPLLVRFLSVVIALEAYHDLKYSSETLVSECEFKSLQSDIMDIIPNDSPLQSQIYGLLDNVANTPSIKSKLITIMEDEEHVLEKFVDIEDLATKARKTRNKIAHGSIDSTSTELHRLSGRLQLVFEVLLAREINIPRDVISDNMSTRYRRLLK